MLVSVVVPCFNVENCVENCVNSVLAQTYEYIELICVDNNSTDNTLKILKQIQEKNNRILIVQEYTPGANAARNKGLSIANGEWIQFLDADDCLLPDKFRDQVELIKNTKTDCDFLVSSYFRKNSLGVKTLISIERDPWLGLISGRLGITSSNLFKRNSINQIGGWDTSKKSSQEAWLMFNLLKKNAAVLFCDVPSAQINERIVGSISFTNRDQNWERYILLRFEILNWLKNEKKLEAYLESVLQRNIFDSIRILYSLNPSKSILLHDKIVKSNFKPLKSSSSSSVYIFVYNLLGFKLTQSFFNLLSQSK